MIRLLCSRGWHFHFGGVDRRPMTNSSSGGSERLKSLAPFASRFSPFFSISRWMLAEVYDFDRRELALQHSARQPYQPVASAPRIGKRLDRRSGRAEDHRT